MRQLAVLGLIAACGLGTLAAGTTAATRGTAATRLVDRTLTCRVGFSNGARLVLPTVGSAARRGATLDWLAYATVATPGNPLSKQNSQPTLAGVTAGWPAPPPLTSGGLSYDNARCGPTRRSVPLSPRGLIGGVASVFGEDLRCVVGKTVLIRVRATFREPAVEEPNNAGTFITALGRVVTGQVAVRTLAGMQIVYADVAEGGRARLFTSRGCS
jgi:hypothetical protein